MTVTYEPVPVSVTSWRSKKPRTVYDYRVIIDGEWRGIYQNNARWCRAGFDLISRIWDYDVTYRKGIPHNIHRYVHRIDRSQFDAGVACALKYDTLPTLAEIERAHLIDEAEKEHAGWTSDRERHHAQVHREMMHAALTQYIDNADGDFPEHIEAARTALERIR